MSNLILDIWKYVRENMKYVKENMLLENMLWEYVRVLEMQRFCVNVLTTF